MAAGASESTREPRLNPFVFPSDTDLRFVLLVVSVLGASLFTYTWLYQIFFGASFWDSFSRCMTSSTAGYRGDLSGTGTNSPAGIEQIRAFDECIEPLEHTQFLWIVSGVALLMAVSGAIYWTIPALKIRRSRLVPLTDERAPGVAAYLGELHREAGLSRPPTVLVNP